MKNKFINKSIIIKNSFLKLRNLGVFGLLVFCPYACEKLVELDTPRSSVTTVEAFGTVEEATSAISGIYFRMINVSGIPFLTAGGMTFFCGMAADELELSFQGDPNITSFYNNSLDEGNYAISQYLWNPGYFNLYQINAVKESLANSSILSKDFTEEKIAQVTIAASLIKFSLSSIFGDIPDVTSTNWRHNKEISRTPREVVLLKIVKDIKDILSKLPDNYDGSENERIFPVKSAGHALLARTLLELGQYEEAELYATQPIENANFKLEALNDVFKYNSNEVIWQLKQSNQTRAATPEGAYFVSTSPFYPPSVLIQKSLLSSFEENDERKSAWIKEQVIDSDVYYYPYKYKIGRLESAPGGPYEEYYVVLRLAEQYLIRAEARANLNKLDLAIEDLNVIRRRAGLPDLQPGLNKEEVLKEVLEERRIELMFEWGHRWADLKRFGKATEILSTNKGHEVLSRDLLFPLPSNDLFRNANLTQNPGY